MFYKESWRWISHGSRDYLEILPANEKQEMVADEIFHTLLTNEKQDKL